MEFSWWLYWEAAEAGGYWEHLQAGGREEAERAARATLLAGDWEPGWVEARIAPLFEWEHEQYLGPDEADISEHYWVSTYIPPAQPPCINGNYHAWEPAQWGCVENPGVKGLGGALILTEFVCANCGLTEQRITGDDPGIHSRNGITYIQPEREEN